MWESEVGEGESLDATACACPELGCPKRKLLSHGSMGWKRKKEPKCEKTSFFSLWLWGEAEQSVCFTLNGNRAREGRQLPGYAAQKADYPRGVVWWRKALWISFLFRAEWKLFVDSKFHSISLAPQAKHRVGVCFGSHLEVSSALEPMRRRSP